MISRLEGICLKRGLRLSEQRRVILRVLDEAEDHPCAAEVYQRVVERFPHISVSTVYRTLNILAEAGLLSRVELGDGKAHYEEARDEHHEHLTDVETGRVLEFHDDTIEALLRKAVGRLGYRLLKYRLELFAVPEATADSFVDRQNREHFRRTVLASMPPVEVRASDPASGLPIRRASGNARRRGHAVEWVPPEADDTRDPPPF